MFLSRRRDHETPEGAEAEARTSLKAFRERSPLQASASMPLSMAPARQKPQFLNSSCGCRSHILVADI